MHVFLSGIFLARHGYQQSLAALHRQRRPRTSGKGARRETGGAEGRPGGQNRNGGDQKWNLEAGGDALREASLTTNLGSRSGWDELRKPKLRCIAANNTVLRVTMSGPEDPKLLGLAVGSVHGEFSAAFTRSTVRGASGQQTPSSRCTLQRTETACWALALRQECVSSVCGSDWTRRTGQVHIARPAALCLRPPPPHRGRVATSRQRVSVATRLLRLRTDGSPRRCHRRAPPVAWKRECGSVPGRVIGYGVNDAQARVPVMSLEKLQELFDWC
mmetsp:Transcript_15505/g.31906  ORF Transcript_15505/g.31906 Transcript_15505/m.31906 type:complete len:273 (-) Transcript_15505:26-844(-)